MSDLKRQIFELLKNSGEPLSMQQIISRITDHHFVSIYRSVDVLYKAGVVKQVSSGFKNLFELSDEFVPHHHHASCEICGRSLAIIDPELESLMDRLCRAAGLSPTTHQFELFGICSDCQARQR